MDNATEMTPEQLVEQINQPEPTDQPVEQPEGFNQEEFNKHFQRLTGLESPDQVKELSTYRDKYVEIEARAKELEQKANQNPFANPFVKSINDMMQQNKNPQDLIPYIALQAKDLNAMSPEEVIKMNKQMEMPSWDSRKIDVWFNSKFPGVDEDADDAMVKRQEREITIEEAAVAARSALESKKVQLTTYDDGSEQRKQELQSRTQGWTTVAKALVERITEVPIRVKDEKIGMDYSLDYKVKLDPAAIETIVATVAQNHAGRGTPMTDAGRQLIQRDIRNMIEFATYRDQLESVVRDAYASARQQVMKEVSNPEPVQKGKVVAPVKKEGRETVTTRGGRNFV